MTSILADLIAMPLAVALSIPFCIGLLSGSIPYGLLLAKLFCGIDPREHGSKNIGTTNIARLCGKKWGVITFICDVLKGALPVAIFTNSGHPSTGPLTALLPIVAGLGAIMGHMFSPWLRFKGGKGVATTMGVFITLCPIPFLIAACLCLAGILTTGFVSVGSLLMSVSLPVTTYLFGNPYQAGLAILVGFFIILAHRQNIQRLIQGTEKSWKKAERK